MSRLTETSEIVDPHDTFFRQLLSDPVVAADFVQNYLPAEVVTLLDLSQLRIEKDTFVDARLRKHYSDVLYSVPLKSTAQPSENQLLEEETPKPVRKKSRRKTATQKQERVFLYLLFEHKSQPDGGVRLQLLRYMVRIWEKVWKKQKQLSPILPIVFYHGVEGWHYSHEFADLLDVPASFKAYTPHFNHLLVDLSAYSDEEVRGEIWLQVCLLMMKHIYDNDLGKRMPKILGLLHELAHEESVMEMLQTVLLYATEVSSVVSQEDVHQSMRAVTTPERSETMEKTLAQKWIEQGREEGIEQGREEGIEQGREEGIEQGREEGKVIAQRQTLSRLLAKRFPETLEESKMFADYFAQISDFDTLVELIDHLLLAPTVAAFEEQLKKFLPKETPKE